MSVDGLQTKMRKQGNNLMVDFTLRPERLPPQMLEAHGDICDAYKDFCMRLLTGLKGKAAAVRFSLTHFVLLGSGGAEALSELLKKASALGFYTLLEIYGISSAEEAGYAAERVWGEGSRFPCDGVLVSAYFGTEVIKPFLPYCEEKKKSLFVLARSANKTAFELQDLLAGSRMAHVAAADYVNRFAAGTVGKYGFSQVGIAASATVSDSVKMLRSKYPKLFMLIDGAELAGTTVKNASYGFNIYGYGAICCLGSPVTCAWTQSENVDFVQAAAAAAESFQARLKQYVP